MNEFLLSIVVPDKVIFKDNVHKFVADTIDGRIGILANHIDYLTSISLGVCEILINNDIKIGLCNNGILTVLNGEAKLIAITFEWIDEIDHDRAVIAKENTHKLLEQSGLTENEKLRLTNKLERAHMRIKASKLAN